MAEKAKKYREAREKVDREKRYSLDEALDLLGQMPERKFDETVEVAMRLGVDPRHADQMVRGSVVLPNGLGKKVRVLVRDRGVPTEKCYPFTGGDGTCGSACADWASRAYRITGYMSVNKTVEDLKGAVAAYGVISAAMMVYDDFFNYRSGVYSYVTGNFRGWHGVNIIGYDDNGRWFIGKNTWGTGWGESGFFRIAYGEVAQGSNFGTSAFAYEKAVIPAITDPIPPLSPTPPAPDEAAAAGEGGQYTKSNCFIATAVYGSDTAPEVVVLRRFRDEHLAGTYAGRKAVALYNRISPPVARYLEPRPTLRMLARCLLSPVVCAIRYPALVPVFVMLFAGAWCLVMRRRRRRVLGGAAFFRRAKKAARS